MLRRPADASEADDDSPDRYLQRLVYARTNMWRLRPVAERIHLPRAPRSGHGQLLWRLLFAHDEGEAWLCRDARNGRGNDVRIVHHAASSPAAIDLASELAADVTRLSSGVDRRPGSRTPLDHFEPIPDLRHRILMDAARARAVLGQVPLPEGVSPQSLHDDAIRYVMLELRFGHALGYVRCFTSTTVWSHLPWSKRYRPALLRFHPAWPARASLECYQRTYTVAGQRLFRLLSEFLEVDRISVLGRRYGLPDFWIAGPREPMADLDDYVSPSDRRPGHLNDINRLAAAFLDVGDVRDRVVSQSVLRGQILALRRLRPVQGQSYVPYYLILPRALDEAAGATGAPMCDHLPVSVSREDTAGRQTVGRQESEIADIVRELTDVESRGGLVLNDVLRELEVWRTHLRVYDAVATKGSFLWDALSTHLPMRRGRTLAKAHKAVELFHQFLLQGISDMAQLTKLARDSRARINELANLLSEQYDDALTERLVHDRADGLRTALVETGLITRAKESADETVELAVRAQTQYTDLLATISSAFDERRVRESDALQKASLLLGVAVAGFGIVTVLDATISMKPPEDTGTIFAFLNHFKGALVHGAAGVTLVAGLALILVVGLSLRWLIRLGTLGSPQLRQLYDGGRRSVWRLWRRPDRSEGMWRFLKDSSSESLRAFTEADPDRAAWAGYDATLANRFARLWDAATTMTRAGRSDHVRRDITALSATIEQWGLHTLLLTERPRRLSHHTLPRLTCLYRVAGRLRGSFLHAGVELPHEVSMVADSEFIAQLQPLGFTEDEAMAVDRWLAAQAPGTAAEALDLITETLGIAADMTAEAVASANLIVERANV
jgi:hypothetical protein